MNKLAKSSIAGAAGIILLMGGAGSLAIWNGSAAISGSGQAVNSGTLNVVAGANGTWKSAFLTATPTSVPAGFTIVPGDTLTYSQTFTINATGNDLLFTVGVTPGALTTSGTASAAQTALIGRLSNTATFTVAGSNITPSGSLNTYKVSTAGATTITVTETINWPFGDSTTATADNAAQTAALSVGAGGAVQVTQVSAP